MTQANVAAIGPLPFITLFELGGIEGFHADNAEAAIKIVHTLLEKKEFKLIILPETFLKETKSLRETIQKTSLSPIFVLVPDAAMKTGMRLEELRSAISTAIGTQIDL